ncbi:MAG: tRNA pseudouridine(38-40) synthase TruA [Acidimicrobiales bacterium]
MPPRGAAREPAPARPKRPASERPPEAPGTKRWRLVVAYDGSAFKGFAAQPNQTTVAGTLADAIARTARLERPPKITCAGRTDAGVHARGQVVHVDLPALPGIRRNGSTRPMEGSDLAVALNRQIAPLVAVKDATPAAAGFDARRSATARRYRYLVWNGPVIDPLLAPTAWHVSGPLELRSMASASDVLVGEHDFGAFCRRPPGTAKGDPLVRRVRKAGWTVASSREADDASAIGSEVAGRLLRFDIEADSFCHQMVRSLVAMLIEVGKGGPTAADVVASLKAADRGGLAAPAPAHGLCLVSVSYGP